MKPFDELTGRGQNRRLLTLARDALRKYSIEVSNVRLLAKHTNTLFRVDTPGDERYMLRVCTPGEHSLRDHQIEAMWLNALAHETKIRVPRLVASRCGEFITHAETLGVPDGRRCMLFEWIEGKPMTRANSIENYKKLGVLSAQLHVHSARLHVPEDMQPMRWDRAFYYPHEPVVVYAPSHAHLFSEDQIVMIRHAEAVVNAALAELYATDQPQLIHGDLRTSNVRVHQDELYALDFEDVIWGFPAQDIAVSLYSARHYRDDFYALCDAFRRGYERVQQWPLASQEQLETLFAARSLMFVNYYANRVGDEGKLADLSRVLGRVEAYARAK